jgi:hypothetical protein
MSNRPNSGAGRFTTLFTGPDASDVGVEGLPAEGAGADRFQGRILPLRSRAFAIGHDTLRALEGLLVLPVSRVVPEAEPNMVRSVALAAE